MNVGRWSVWTRIAEENCCMMVLKCFKDTGSEGVRVQKRIKE